MTSGDFNKAGRLQQANIGSEGRKLDEGLDWYSEGQVNQAIVHTRQDVTLLVSLLDSQNERQQKILNRLNILVAIGISALFLIAQK